MKKHLSALISFLVTGSFFAPIVALATNTALKPIVPQETCPLGYGAMFGMVQTIMSDAVILATIFMVVLIAYSGFLFVTNPASPDNISKGRTVLIDAIIGFVIVLSAWLLVNELMAVFTTGGLASFTALLKPTGATNCL